MNENERVKEAIEAYKSALAEAGFVIVPKKPTSMMIDVAYDTDHTIEEGIYTAPTPRDQIAAIWRAMIGAALPP